MLKPTDCIAKDFSCAWYKKWIRLLGLPAAHHPKFWEMAALAEALDARKCLRPGKVGLGMGVGNEQLASLFASRGASIVATDQDPTGQAAQKWDNGQLAHGIGNLFYPHIIDRLQFDQKVSYEPYDMNTDNPAFADKFDFVWHNCVIGHLGSLEQSVAQLMRSAAYVRPGGWLVCTTELNISSFTETVSEGSDTVVWRLSDLEALFVEMATHGMVAERFTLRLGESEADTRVNYNYMLNVREQMLTALDDPTFCEIKIPFAGFVITQILLCFQKVETRSFRIQAKWAQDTQKNTQVILKHARRNSDLRDYFTPVDTIQYADAQLMPESKEISVTMQAGALGQLDLRFLNRSELRLFDFSLNTPFNRPPLVVATFDPVNRDSAFATKDWSSPNRPTLIFSQQRVHAASDWNAHRANGAQWFEYSFPLKAPRKAGTYTESFVLVFEGAAVVLSSIVTVTIVVTAAPKALPAGTRSGKPDILPVDFFHKIGWQEARHASRIPRQFAEWLSALGQQQFRARRIINPYEFLSLLEAYLATQHPHIAVPDKVRANVVAHQSEQIIINPPALVTGVRARLVILGCTPRVGGTVFSHLLSELTGWPHYAVSSLEMMNLRSLSGPTIIHLHMLREDYLAQPPPLPHQVITLARNPLDTLVSAFAFAQRNPGVVFWLNQQVFAQPPSFVGKKADSPEFFEWAMSQAGQHLLSVTPSWWEHAAARATYEDFRQNPGRVLGEVLRIIDPERGYDVTEIQQAVQAADRDFLATATNGHRWNGGSNYAEKLIPADKLARLKAVHAEVIEQLGYSI